MESLYGGADLGPISTLREHVIIQEIHASSTSTPRQNGHLAKTHRLIPFNPRAPILKKDSIFLPILFNLWAPKLRKDSRFLLILFNLCATILSKDYFDGTFLKKALLEKIPEGKIILIIFPPTKSTTLLSYLRFNTLFFNYSHKYRSYNTFQGDRKKISDKSSLGNNTRRNNTPFLQNQFTPLLCIF